ncbi:MAG: phospholipid carrier-dependent glycosyltransferase [bacterium]|nr:phospholipid carrier-dependent glycosyltransferase [bacterium]
MNQAYRAHIGIGVGLFALALGFRLALRGALFDGLYGQDAYAYFDVATQIVRGEPIMPFYWGIGYPLVLAGGFAIFGISPAVAQTFNMVMGAALAPMLYSLARGTGLLTGYSALAGLLIAFSGQAAQSSLVVMADIPALFWAVLSAICLCMFLGQPARPAWGLVSVACLMLAVITRWLYLALIPAWCAWALFGLQRERVRFFAGAGAVSALVLLPQIAFSIVHPVPVIDHAWVQGWSLAHAGERAFVNVDGTFAYAQVNALFYAAPLTDPYYLAPVFALFIPVGLWVIRRQLPLWCGLVGWLTLPYLFLIGIPYQNLRFPLIMLPASILLALTGLAHVVTVWAAHMRLRQMIRVIVLIGVCSGLITMSETRSRVESFIAAQLHDQAAVAWAAEMLPDHALVYTLGLTLPLRRLHDGEVRDLYYETFHTLRTEAEQDRTAYLLVNRWQIENQWQGFAPSDAFYWLRTRRGIIRAGQHGNYTLYWVRP